MGKPDARKRWTLALIGVVIAGVAVTSLVLVGVNRSAFAVPSSALGHTAKAITPLSLASKVPEPDARDARLPPLLGTGDVVSATLEVKDATVRIANGVSYEAWTFGGTVPAPILHVRQGQTVKITLVNHGTMPHSIDFHAAQVAPEVGFRSVDPGQSLELSFVAKVPGAFVYHCGTPPMLMHMGNGMYGALIVDPDEPLPSADTEYVLVQSEWYTEQVEGTLLRGNLDKMYAASPDEVVFNGCAFQYEDHPLPAKVGKRTRLYVIDAGPNLQSAFHVVGSIFAAVYPDGDPAHALTNVSTYPLAPGAGAVFDVIPAQAGKYPFVDHGMRNMEIGACGVLDAQP